MKPGDIFNPYKMFVGSFIPNVLLRTTLLTAHAKLVWARLAQFNGKNGQCYPSQATIAEETGSNIRKVQRSLQLLSDKGFIKKIPPTGIDRLFHKHIQYEFLWHEVFCVSALAARGESEDALVSSAIKENHTKENQEEDIVGSDELDTPPKSKTAAKKDTDPNHAVFRKWFCEVAYPAHMGNKYVFCGGKDAALIKGLLRNLTVDELKTASEVMFSDSFAQANGAGLNMLSSQINKWLSGKVDTGGDSKPDYGNIWGDNPEQFYSPPQ